MKGFYLVEKFPIIKTIAVCILVNLLYFNNWTEVHKNFLMSKLFTNKFIYIYQTKIEKIYSIMFAKNIFPILITHGYSPL